MTAEWAMNAILDVGIGFLSGFFNLCLG